VVVSIGPEGGFTDDELAQATAQGWRIVGLGPLVLRVETAGLAVAATVLWASGISTERGTE
jgi:16S rRNA (uracil1498-N3)-methyltransferase